jgi:hypothetical protein
MKIAFALVVSAAVLSLGLPVSKHVASPGATSTSTAADPEPSPVAQVVRAFPPAKISLPAQRCARFEPGASQSTLVAGRVTAASDLEGLANASAAGVGPQELVDAKGRKFWRFDGTATLTIADALNAGTRASAVVAVVRLHKSKGFNPTFVSLGGASGVVAGRIAHLPIAASGQAPFVGNAGQAKENRPYLVAGSQMQVLGWFNRSSDQRVYVNERAENAPRLSIDAKGAGATVGAYSFSPGRPGTFLTADIYSLVVCGGAFSDAQADAIVRSYLAAYADVICPIANQVLIEGDSRLDGVAALTSADTISMQMTEPGKPYSAPCNTRVINMAVSGSTTDIGANSVVARRDVTTNAMSEAKLPGTNKLAVMIGVNDWSRANNRDPATTYAHLVPIFNSPSNGYLQRGWDSYLIVEMASSTANNAKVAEYRALQRSPRFLADTLSGPGQQFAGRMHLIDLPRIKVGRASVFDTGADAGIKTYYQDFTHPTVVGTRMMVTGGDTPQYGLRSLYR